METFQLSKSFQQGSLEAPTLLMCWGWEAERGSGIQLIPLLTPLCQVRHPAPSPWYFGVSLCLAPEPYTALLVPHHPLSQLTLPFQVSTRALKLYKANNWAWPVITYCIPFVTTGSICSLERMLQLPTLPPIASLHKLHFDPH